MLSNNLKIVNLQWPNLKNGGVTSHSIAHRPQKSQRTGDQHEPSQEKNNERKAKASPARPRAHSVTAISTVLVNPAHLTPP